MLSCTDHLLAEVSEPTRTLNEHLLGFCAAAAFISF